MFFIYVSLKNNIYILLYIDIDHLSQFCLRFMFHDVLPSSYTFLPSSCASVICHHGISNGACRKGRLAGFGTGTFRGGGSSANCRAWRRGNVATWQRTSQRVPTREFDRYFHQGTTWKSHENDKQPSVVLSEGFGPKGLWVWTQTAQTHVPHVLWKWKKTWHGF